MHNVAAGCFGAVIGFAGGVTAGIVIGEQFVRPGIDGLPPKLALFIGFGIVFLGLGFIAARRAARRQNPTDE